MTSHRRQHSPGLATATALLVTVVMLVSTRAHAQEPRAAVFAAVEQALGRTGTVQGDGVLRVAIPRRDIVATLDGVRIAVPLALGGWVAFESMGASEVMVMGDLVLLQDEVPAVMRALLAGGIDVSALHNHLVRETPHLMYMHIAGHGQGAVVAHALRSAIDASGAPPATAVPAAPPVAGGLDLDTAAVARNLGARGRTNGSVWQVGVPRREAIAEGGRRIPASMGTATALNFQPVGGGRAAITGDFVLLGAEVAPVVRFLVAQGIAVTAVHSHMLDESPRLYMVHFWAVDDAPSLATRLRGALDLTNHELPAR